MNKKQTVTKEEFEQDYADGSNMTVEQLQKMGGFVEPCDCEYSGCRGWEMLFRTSNPEFALRAYTTDGPHE